MLSAVLTAASIPAVGYLFALRYTSVFRSRCSRQRDPDVIGPRMSLSGADLAATNCLLALPVLRFALDQPEADLASAVPIWLLLLHPLPLLWYWAQANIRRYVAKKRGKVGRGRSDADHSGYGRRRQFSLASRKLLRVTRNLKANSLDDDQLQAVERITVV